MMNYFQCHWSFGIVHWMDVTLISMPLDIEYFYQLVSVSVSVSVPASILTLTSTSTLTLTLTLISIPEILFSLYLRCQYVCYGMFGTGFNAL